MPSPTMASAMIDQLPDLISELEAFAPANDPTAAVTSSTLFFSDYPASGNYIFFALCWNYLAV